MDNPNLYTLRMTPDLSALAPAAKAGAGDGSGYSGFYAPPLGASHSDVYRKSKAPTPRELVQQLIGTAYACADLNAGAVAANGFKLYIRTGGGDQRTKLWKTSPVNSKRLRYLRKAGYISGAAQTPDIRRKDAGSPVAADGEIEEITDETHPLMKLFKQPTQDPNGLSSFDHRYCTQLYLESIGRAYWWMPRNGLGVPQELWLLRSHMVREIPDLSGASIIKRYDYGRQQLDPDEVIKFHFPDPDSLYMGGYSPMMASIEKVRIGRKEDAHLNALLDNMGRPDAVLIPRGDTEGSPIGADEARRWRSSFQQEFARAGRGGIMVSEFPGSLEVLGWRPQDVVEIERAAQIKNAICNCFGVPDTLLERNAANLASAKTSDYSHAKYAINPRCTRMAEVLNARLVSLFDPTGRTFIAYDNPIPDDEVFELEVTKAGSVTGVSKVNETRAALGLPALPDAEGDCRYILNTMVPVGPDGLPILPKPPEPPATPPVVAPAKTDTANADGKMFDKALNVLVGIVERMGAAEAKRDEGFKQLLDLTNRMATQREKEDGTAKAVATANERTINDSNRDPAPNLDASPPAPQDAKAVNVGSLDVLPAVRLGHASGGEVLSDVQEPVGEIQPLTALPDGHAIAVTLRGIFKQQRDAVIQGMHKAEGKSHELGNGSTENETASLRDNEGGGITPSVRGSGSSDEASMGGGGSESGPTDRPRSDIATKDEDKPRRVGFGGDDGLPEKFIDLSAWDETIAHACMPTIEVIAHNGATRLLTRVGASADVWSVVNRQVPEAARKLTLKFSQATNATTTQQLDTALSTLREEIAQGLESGDVRQELTKRVMAVFDLAEEDRADRIAKTEASRAIHQGEIVGAKASGVVKTKNWLLSSDACPICDEIAAAHPDGIELDANFGETDYGPIGEPPAHPNCQCSLTYGLKDLSKDATE